jgi:hypothetical protein
LARPGSQFTQRVFRDIERAGNTRAKEKPTMTALVGKYFTGVYDGALRSGIIEDAVSPTHYLVRFDDFVGFTDGSKWPPSLAVVPTSEMAGGADMAEDEGKPPPWDFFDNQDQRARYDEWLSQPTKPQVIRLVDRKPH